MTTTTAANTTAAAASTSASGGALKSLSGNFNDFLKLLMTQLQNQDPTAPLDTNQFTSQLVQFSSVEQQINTNGSLTKLIELQQGNEVLQSSALVGKSVQVTSDKVPLQGGAASVQFNTASPQTVSIGVFTDSGAKIRDAVVNTQAGSNAWQWDGRDNNANTVVDGAYRTVVTAVDAAGGTQALPFTVAGTAVSVQRGTNGLNVQLGSLQVPLSAVQTVR